MSLGSVCPLMICIAFAASSFRACAPGGEASTLLAYIERSSTRTALLYLQLSGAPCCASWQDVTPKAVANRRNGEGEIILHVECVTEGIKKIGIM